MFNDNSSESSYIIDCKNPLIYNMINNNYAEDKKEETYLKDNNIVSVELTENELENIKKTGAVIEEDICVTGSAEKTDVTKQTKADKVDKFHKENKKDTQRELPWNVESLGVTEETQNLEDSSESNESQDKVKVAILDSGVDFSENINVVARKNFMGDEVSPLYEDNTGHGTAIAGIIASSGEDGMVKGVNPNVEIYSARILDEDNKAPISRVVESIYWAIEEDVDIINISFGTTVNSEILHNAIKDATDAGILVFAASGNQGENEGSTVEYPAAYEEVVAVGATNPDGKVADMTSTGEELDIVAPGINIHSVGWLDMEVVCNGTSMAVPHAVGAASLLWEMDKDKTADFIKGLLEASAKTVEDDGEEYSYIDVEYAKEIYDDYSEKYRATEDVDELNEVYENEEEVEAYDEAVTGSWTKGAHNDIVDYAAKNSLGTSTSVKAEIVKLGAKYNDKEESGIKGMHDNPEWHGCYERCNYFACYNYATLLALAGGDGSKVKSDYPRYEINYKKMRDAVTTKGINGVKWSVILADYNYKSKSDATQKNYRKYFIYGMAIHSATDVFAHSCYHTDGTLLDHVRNNLADVETIANSTKKNNRYKAAKGVALEAFMNLNGDSAGMLWDFINQYKYFGDANDPVKLCNVMWYADGAGMDEYGDTYKNRLKLAATGNYIDIFYENY